MKTKLMAFRALATVGLATASLATASLAGAASARTFTATYTGETILGSVDPDDLFGGDAAVADGTAVTAIFAYDDTLGTRTSTPTSDILSGDYPYDLTFPVTEAKLVIGGDAYSFTPDYQADVETGQALYDNDIGQYNGVFDDAEDFAGDGLRVGLPLDTSPIRVETPFTASGDGFGDFTKGDDAVDFEVTSVTVSATPEPASWALMIAGVAMAGATLRLRRRQEPTPKPLRLA